MLEGILSSLKTALVPGTLFVTQKKLQKSRRKKTTKGKRVTIKLKRKSKRKKTKRGKRKK